MVWLRGWIAEEVGTAAAAVAGFAVSSSGDAAGEAVLGCSAGTEHGSPEYEETRSWKLCPDSVMRLRQGQPGGKRVWSPGDRG